MKVGDIKLVEPLADVYEFDPEKQYIIYVPLGTDMRALMSRGGNLGIRAQIIAVDDPHDVVITEKFDG